jgi:hypothetical protein
MLVVQAPAHAAHALDGSGLVPRAVAVFGRHEPCPYQQLCRPAPQAATGRPSHVRPRHRRGWCRPPGRRLRRTVPGCTIVRASCPRDHALDNRPHTPTDRRALGACGRPCQDGQLMAQRPRRPRERHTLAPRRGQLLKEVCRSLFMTRQHGPGARTNQAASRQTHDWSPQDHSCHHRRASARRADPSLMSPPAPARARGRRARRAGPCLRCGPCARGARPGAGPCTAAGRTSPS